MEATHERGTRPHLLADRNPPLALFVFVLLAAVALVVLFALGRNQWFLRDEWDFLVARDGGIGDLLRPHNEHWSTLPILVYRLLFQLFGLHTYVPYQLVLILLHLTAAFLLRAVMRRAGVGPWIASAAAALFMLFGAGDENIVWAFQMGFVGSLVFGLTQLLLADHDGPIARRDWLALLAGLAGLLCSGVGVTMVVVVGLATLARRGWRVALFHTAPLGGLYALWWVSEGRDAYGNNDGGGLGQLARFGAIGMGATFDAMGQLPGAGIALGVLLVVGLTLAWHGLDRAELRKRAAAPAALLIGAVVFLVITGLGRASIILSAFGQHVPGRYLHLVAALSLPAIAVAADAVARRWWKLAPAVLALFLVGIPGNLYALADYNQRVGHLPRKPFLEYSLLQSEQRTNAANCAILGTPVKRRLDTGQSLRINGGRVRVFDLGFGGFLFLAYDPADGHTLTARVGPLKLRLASDNRARPAVLCSG